MDVPQIDVGQLAEAREAGAFVLDVRQPDEYDQAHVPGAVLVPLAEVPDRVAEIPPTGPIYVICRSGARSQRAAEHLRSLHLDARNVSGGTLAWIEAGYPVASGPEAG
mgnify:CR=1 FL=1